MKLKRFCATLAALFFPVAVQAIEISKSPSGVPYGFVSAGNAKPLAVIFTTSIEESLGDVYTPLGAQLRKQGFAVLSLDVPCHGRNLRHGEVAGLDCWAARVSRGDTGFFDTFARQVDEVIGLLVGRGEVDTSFIVAIGVSRGGYVALRQLSISHFVNAVVGLAPVTDLKKLSEFGNTPVDQGLLGFGPYYRTMSTKKVFIQIGNNDDRVGTQASISLVSGVVAANRASEVDATMMLMPYNGHGTSKDNLAFDWILRERASAKSAVKKAP